VAAGNPEAHLGVLFGMSDDYFLARVDGGTDETKKLQHLGVARAVCQWLDGRGQLWPFYQGWRDDLATDRDGVATFTRVTGRPPSDPETDRAWRTWVMHTR